MARIFWIWRYLRIHGGLIMNDQQQQDLKDFYSTILKPGDLVFDIGANVGNYTKVFIELGCMVVSVEPQEHCVQQLKNKYGTMCTIIQAACGAKHGDKATILQCNTDPCTSLSVDWIQSMCKVMPNWMIWVPTSEVNIISLDEMIKIFGIPKYIKIDVEGYEYEVIKGLTTPIDIVSFEYNKVFIAPVYNTLEYIFKLGQYKYNYMIGDTTTGIIKLHLEKNTQIHDIIIAMNELTRDGASDKTIGHGDIFAFKEI